MEVNGRRNDTPRLSIANIRKNYGTTMAVDGISVDVQEGEFVSLLGASGSGKSTTLMICAGFERPTSGAVHMDGRDITGLPPHKRGIGMVFQSYSLFPHMTVTDNLAYPLRRRKMGRLDISRRVERSLRLVDLMGYGGRYPRQLSGGQQQRVALARALIFEPPILLMDEPLAALDKKLREQMQVELAHIHRQLGVTVLYVTHDQGEALGLSDRIVVMHRGRVAQVGTPTEVYTRPKSLFVARFIGDSNVLIGIAEQVVDGRVLVRLGDGEQAWASAPIHIGAGDPVAIVTRPEHLELGTLHGPSASSAAEHAGVSVRLVGSTYMGSLVRWEARARDDTRIAIHVPTGSAALTIGGAGDEVLVRWAANDAIALPVDDGADLGTEDESRETDKSHPR